ncbi:hypothetical protein VCR29J2_360645 [Vibrio coralliirubri]|nr:hypothetical protein VCR29J2_360645 [Vibrio coralliirubri]
MFAKDEDRLVLSSRDGNRKHNLSLYFLQTHNFDDWIDGVTFYQLFNPLKETIKWLEQVY